MNPQCAFLALTLMAAPLTSEAAVTIAALNTPYAENFDTLASVGYEFHGPPWLGILRNRIERKHPLHSWHG